MRSLYVSTPRHQTYPINSVAPGSSTLGVDDRLRYAMRAAPAIFRASAMLVCLPQALFVRRRHDINKVYLVLYFVVCVCVSISNVRVAFDYLRLALRSTL